MGRSRVKQAPRLPRVPSDTAAAARCRPIRQRGKDFVCPRWSSMRARLLRPAFGGEQGNGPLGSLSATLGSGTLIQILGAVAGFVVVPFLVGHLGPGTYGVLVVIVSLGPWLALVDSVLHPAVRLLVGESRFTGEALAPPTLVSRAFRVALKVAALNLGTLLLALVVLPLVSIFGASGVIGHGDLVAGILAFAVPVIVSSPGAVYVGALEGVGRTVAASVISGLGPLALLPLTLVAIRMGSDFWVICLVQGIAVSLPRYLAWIYWLKRPSLRQSEEGQSGRLRASLLLSMFLLSSSYLVQNGFDPVIVSSRLGAEAAGAFGIASRIVLGSIIPVMVLTPLFTANLAVARSRGWTPAASRELLRLQAQAVAIGGLVGLTVVVLGPVVAGVLGAGEIGAPLSLYLAAGLYAFSAYASAPLMVAFSGPSGLKRSAKVSLWSAVANLSLSLWWVGPLGPSGPLWASAAVTLTVTLHWLLMWRIRPAWLSEIHR